jgi:DNA-dependent protein kinase catalytic subunit
VRKGVLKQHSSQVIFLHRFEFGMHNMKYRQGIGKRPMMVDMADTFTLKTALSWFDMLLCTLDCYTWVFGSGLLTPTKTLLGM